MEVTIPANTTATIYVPTKDVNTVTEAGQPVAQAKGVKFIGMKAGAAVYTVGAGTYQFSSTLR
jgi:alpha-L-rhamnosidase